MGTAFKEMAMRTRQSDRSAQRSTDTPLTSFARNFDAEPLDLDQLAHVLRRLLKATSVLSPETPDSNLLSEPDRATHVVRGN